MKLRTNDKVKVISGKDRGHEGTVGVLFPKSGQILIEGVNMATQHIKKNAQNKEGGRVKVAKPIDASNVMIICGKCNKITRIGFKFVDGKKVRSCKKCGEVL